MVNGKLQEETVYKSNTTKQEKHQMFYSDETIATTPSRKESRGEQKPIQTKQYNKRMGLNKSTSNYRPPPSFASSLKEVTFVKNRIPTNIRPNSLLQHRYNSDRQIVHPSREQDDGIDIPIIPRERRRNSTGNMEETASEEILPTTTLRSAVSLPSASQLLSSCATGSAVSSLSSSCETGSNLYNYMPPQPPTTIKVTIANDCRDHENTDNQICLLSSAAATSSRSRRYKGINKSLRRVLSNMSDDSLLIMEENDDEEEDCLSTHSDINEGEQEVEKPASTRNDDDENTIITATTESSGSSWMQQRKNNRNRLHAFFRQSCKIENRRNSS